MGIIMTFNTPPVLRLKSTFTELSKSKKSWTILKTLQEISIPFKGFRNVRNLMESTASIICVPYVGIYLNDYTLIDEKSPDFIDQDKVNFSKWQQLLNCMHNLLGTQKFLSNSSLVKTEPLYTLVYSLSCLSENDLFILSEKRESKIVPL